MKAIMADTFLCETMTDSVPTDSIGAIARPRYANVLGVSIDAVDREQALAMVSARLQQGRKGYVCFVDVHGILEALKSASVAETYAHAAMAMPDGTPTVWVGRAQGLRKMNYVTGPGMMNEIFRRGEFADYSHYFYGGEPGVADDLAATLCRKYPWTRIVGIYTPPFRELTAREEDELVAEVSQLKPDIVWVGIGTPRQDLWMRKILPRLETRMMFGVGAAFDFLTGRVRLCPEWMKRAGLHWLHRLVQNPRRLWMRNVRNTAFLWHVALQLSGARRYPMRSRAEGAEQPSKAERTAEPEMAESTL